MYTICPACHRQYRIHAEQLSAADGMVRCGFCGEQFSALESLSDMPSRKHGRPVNLRASAGPTVPGPSYPDKETGMREEDLPEILREPEAGKHEKRPRMFWSVAALIFVLVLAAQLAWFNRDYLLSNWPDLRPWAQKLCAELDCEIIREYRTSDIKLLSRDVRLHPRYTDTLLVNATMANYSDTVQPYPDIQFALFDTSGRMIAAREFKPEEYLDNSIAIGEGMSSRQPVHFVLEVTGPTTGAVSFEFRFL